MYAVIETGGHQLRVEVGEVVHVARLPEDVGGSVVFDRVLMVGGDEDVKLGAPTLDGAKVRGTVVAQDRDRKVQEKCADGGKDTGGDVPAEQTERTGGHRASKNQQRDMRQNAGNWSSDDYCPFANEPAGE